MSSSRPPLSSRPTFLPDEIARREFATVFRGYDPAEVRTFLNQMAEQMAETADRIAEVQRSMADLQERASNPELTEEMVTALLGEQTAQILRSAREAASDIRIKAEDEVSRQLREAHEVTTKMREEAEAAVAERTSEADRRAEATRAEAVKFAEEVRRSANEDATNIRAEVAAEAERKRAELESDILQRREQTERDMHDLRTQARQQARDMIDLARQEAQALVERTQVRQTELVEGLVRKRKIAIAQVEELRAGRERLLKAYKMVRGTLDEVTNELERVEAEARGAAVLAGQRSAAANDLTQDDLDTVVDLEDFTLGDDVSMQVIDLVEGGTGEARADSAASTEDPAAQDSESSGDSAGSGSPFDFMEEVVDVTDPEDEAADDSSSGGAGPRVGATGPSMSGSAVATEAPAGPRSLVIGEAYVVTDEDEMDRALRLRRDAVVGKARSQATRRLKRALQEEQEQLVTRLRTGDGRSVQALLGSIDDQAASYHRAVVKLLREVARTGASSVEGSTGVERGLIDRTGTTAARGLAHELVEDLRGQLQPVLEQILASDQSLPVDELQLRIAEPYHALKGEYLDRLVDDRIGGAFDQGVGFARQG